MALCRCGMLPHSPHIISQTLRQPCGKIHPDRRGLLLLLYASDMVSRKMKCLADREGRCVVSSWCLPPYQFSHVSKNDWLTWLYWELFQSIWNAFTLCIWHFFKKSYFFPTEFASLCEGWAFTLFLTVGSSAFVLVDASQVEGYWGRKVARLLLQMLERWNDHHFKLLLCKTPF